MLQNAVISAFMLLLMALAIIVGAYIFIYAAHRFLVIVQETAAGVDEVRYPSDPIMDKLPRAAYLAGLLVICVAPAGLFLRVRPDVALGDSPMLTFFVAATIILWLVFPVGLLSALSASSPWIVFRWTVVRFLARHAGATIVFYAVSALLASGTFGLLYLGFARDSWLFTLAAPFAGAAAFLIYARLLGRMAYLFDQTPTRRRRRRPPVGTESLDPWSEPEPGTERKRMKQGRLSGTEDFREPPEERALKKRKKSERIRGYAIADDETNPGAIEQPKAKRPAPVKGYRLADEPLPAQPTELPLDGYVPVGYEAVPARKESETESAPRPDSGMASDFERRYSERDDETPPPARPLVSGVYSFPWYASNLPVWIILALGGAAVCSLIHVCIGLEAQLGK
ncbi:MAG TPA: hypothetical protein VKE94_07445 [Gemmataceae bacterium]|nr:hypothetical protein [Gemmataceae bacterium]